MVNVTPYQSNSNNVPIPRRTPNLIGITYNQLTVVSFFGKDKKNNSLWNCVCTCGNYKEAVLAVNLKNGQAKSCGCLVKEQVSKLSRTHGLSGHPLYKIWEGVKSRCHNPNATYSKYYGKKGVYMCEEWRNNPIAFIEWGEKNGWKKGLQIDKDIIPKKLGIEANIYSPETCCFVTPKVNANNRINNHYLVHNGVKGTLADWGRISGVSGKQIKRNLDKGWTVEESIYNKRNFEKLN